MPRRPKRNDPEIIRQQLADLIREFEKHLRTGDLREKVRALIPCHRLLRDLGCSLIPDSESARDRILIYLRKYPFTVIAGEELAIVSGISEWARRVRELRVQDGWLILSGTTAAQMAEAGEFPLKRTDATKMQVDDYILVATEADLEAANRWHFANRIRRKKGVSVQDRILEYLQKYVGKPVTGEELRYIAGDKIEWPRRSRELRTEEGWPVATKLTGRPDLPVGVYLLESLRQLPPHDRKIDDAVRVQVLERDKYSCTWPRCGWRHGMENPSDPRRYLELHHILKHEKRGPNTAENLRTLCNVHHDEIHRESA
jgi:hypothetical protein